MKKVLASLALILTLALPNLGFTAAPPTVEELMGWAGCTAELVTGPDIEVIRSMYGITEDGQRKLYIGLVMPEGMTPEMFDMIVLHEIGHCLQDQDGNLWNRATVEVELEADRISADLACLLGRDGRSLLRQLWAWAHDRYGYDGDPKHGTLVERVGQGDNASVCTGIPKHIPHRIEPQS